MTDWKKKLGFIVPSWNTVMEYECQRMAPAGVSVHFTRIAHTDDEEETLLHMIEVVPELADLLGHASLDAICFGCTGGSFVRPGMDEDIIAVIEERTGIPATTTSTALTEAMREMGVAKVALASPYPQVAERQAHHFPSQLSQGQGNRRGGRAGPERRVPRLPAARELRSPGARGGLSQKRTASSSAARTSARSNRSTFSKRHSENPCSRATPPPCGTRSRSLWFRGRSLRRAARFCASIWLPARRA